MSDNSQNQKLIYDLKNLPKIDAPKNFETELRRKINSSEKAKIENFWDKIFSSGKLAPAAVALASAVIIFFIVDGNSEVMEDPLNIEPRLREDILIAETMDEVNPKKKNLEAAQEEKSDKNIVRQKSIKESVLTESDENFDKNETKMPAPQKQLIAKDNDESTIDSNNSGRQLEFEDDSTPAAVNLSSQEINRNSLNFMRKSLSTQEVQKVKQLKMKVSNIKNAENEQDSSKME